MHLVETGEINYTVIDENIAQASSYSMKNLDIALKLKEDISVSWATHSDASLLSSEINNWLEEIRKNGKLNYLYKRYFGKHPAVPHNTTKYTLIKKGDISPFDKLFRKESKKLGWDWRLLAALVYTNLNSILMPNRKSEPTV